MLANRRSAAWGIVISVLFVAAVLGILLLFGVDEQVLQLSGVLFTTGAGFVFGVVDGTLYVVLGTTLGAMFAFLIARHLLGARARGFILTHARIKLISEEMAPQGWKIVMLTRLVPFFPFKLSNYFFGLTPFSLRGFAVGTFLGIIPFSLHNVYLGSIAADFATLGARNSDRTALEWGLYGAGFLVAIGVVLYLNRLARRALVRYTEEDGRGEG